MAIEAVSDRVELPQPNPRLGVAADAAALAGDAPSPAVSALRAPAANAVRSNWRDIDVVDLTDAEIALMTPEEDRWCSDLLVKRHLARNAPQAQMLEKPVGPIPALDIDAGGIAVTHTGLRIRIYPGEGFNADSFAGEIINPTERQMRGHGHVSCLWDRSKVVRIDPATGGQQ